MSLDRTNIIRGPCMVELGSQKFLTKGDAVLEITKRGFPIETADYGKIEERLEDSEVKVRFTPAGVWATALNAVLFPHADPTFGASIFGASDAPCYIWGQDDVKVTIAAAAITKMPSIFLSATKTLFGECEISGVLAKGTTRVTANSVFTVGSGSYPALTSFDRTAIRTCRYGFVWGSSPWDEIHPEAGVQVDFNMNLEPVKGDTEGTIDMTLSGVEVTARFVPLTQTLANALDKMLIQGSGGGIGDTFFTQGADLVVTGPANGDPKVTVKKAAFVDSFQSRWGGGTKRLSEMLLRAQRGITSGDPDPLFALETVGV